MRARTLGFAFVVALLLPAAQSGAAPGTPGTPDPPGLVFQEAFENVANPAQGQRLATYTGPPPLSMTYTAHPNWLNAAACNGIIASFNSTTGTSGCSSSVYNNFIRPIARGMGAALGGGDDNQVMADVTVSGFPAAPTPAATLQTVKPIPLASPNRFITFSIDAGAVSCGAAHPLLRFFLLNGGSEIAATNNAIDACTDPRGSTVSGVRVGSYASDASFLFSGGSLGVKLTNDQTSGSGNDYAVDNLRVLDATPQLDKDFEDPETLSGRPATLKFTITNTSDLAAKKGWSFTDTLPSGLEVADPADATIDCPGGSISASPGGSSIDVSGNLDAGQASCVARVEVVSPRAGTFENCASNISALVGLDPPGCTTLRVQPVADLSVQKLASAERVEAGGQVMYTLVVRNEGPDGATGVTATDTVPPGMEVVSANPARGTCTVAADVSCALGDLEAGGSTQILVTANVPARTGTGPATNTVEVAGEQPDPDPDDNRAEHVVTIDPPPPPPEIDLQVRKSASSPEVDPGDELIYTLVIANNGPDDATDVSLVDTPPGGVRLVSASSAQGTCTIDQVVTCALGRLPGGGQTQVLVTAEVTRDAEGILENAVTVTAAETDTNPANNLATRDVTVSRPGEQAAADLRITKRSTDSDPRTGRATFKLVIKNNGPATANDVRVVDTPSRAVEVLSADPAVGRCEKGPPIECALGDLPAGERTAITVAVKLTERGELTNVASVVSDSADANAADNLDEARAKLKPGLEISKRASVRRVVPGENVRFAIKVKNPAGTELRGVKVCDNLPKGLAYVRSNPRADKKNGRRCWRLGRLAAGASVSFELVARYTGRAGKVTNRAKVDAVGAKASRDRASVAAVPAAGDCPLRSHSPGRSMRRC